MKVSLISPTFAMLTQHGVEYAPTWPGLDLLPEGGDPQVSVENVRRLLDGGLAYCLMVSGPAGVVLVFQTGEAILLTGLALGGGPKTEALAAVGHQLGLGDQEALAHWYTSLGGDYSGPIPR